MAGDDPTQSFLATEDGAASRRSDAKKQALVDARESGRPWCRIVLVLLASALVVGAGVGLGLYFGLSAGQRDQGDDTPVDAQTGAGNESPEPVAASPTASASGTDTSGGPYPKVTNGSLLEYRIVNKIPHDPGAFTQGILYYAPEDVFYTSNGEYGKSNLRKVSAKDGKVLQEHILESQYFAEGLALHKDKLYQLTWQKQTGFIYDRSSLTQVGTWSYRGQGWGLTTGTEGKVMYMSDGTDIIRHLDPQSPSLDVIKEVHAHSPGENRLDKLDQLNELEFIDGELWANKWYSNRIYCFDPDTGNVNSQIDLSGLVQAQREQNRHADVLNGIAYDETTGRVWVTGKRWDTIYEIETLGVKH
ncbi:Glutaminyl-peptide cyclotransferase [Porphyridium purpureum]|uniref:Glutaminyl-peptide cyclotransferase n=1 Tax=Porphyridium purpureum TaxID=35688 RepID=A0A5J4Z7C5_PORPP|nr:Glutaminyl-peptide cyclotransferase [Porphyridium purpureum]|eukprot:POR0475..scf295_1